MSANQKLLFQFILYCFFNSKIWDLREGRLFYTLHGHSGPTTSARFSPDGTRLATGGTDARVLVWRAPLEMTEGGSGGSGIGATEDVDDARKRKGNFGFGCILLGHTDLMRCTFLFD
jgi:WD40 repeat protein